MKSAIKAKLNLEQLQLLVKRAFGPDAKLTEDRELTAGWFNTGYELALQDGRRVILKVAPSQDAEVLDCEVDIMRTEVEALRLISATGRVPVPEVYFYDNSLGMIPYSYFFMEKMEGRPYNEIKESLSQQEREAIEHQAGVYNCLINEVKGERFGALCQENPATDRSWRETFARMIEALLQDGERLSVPLPAPYAEFRTWIKERLPALDEVTQPRLLHWDLWNGNIFVKDGVITAIIDWERALWGDELMEFYFRHLENSAAFLEGYGTTADSPNERERRRLYDLYFDLILVIECYSRQYEDERHIKWTHEHLAQVWANYYNEGGAPGAD